NDNPDTSDSGAYSEYVMVLPGSTNMAPPPLIRRTTVTSCLAAPSMSTSLAIDWKLPMITAFDAQSHTRNDGGRSPAATCSARTSSKAICIGGWCAPSTTNCQS